MTFTSYFQIFLPVRCSACQFSSIIIFADKIIDLYNKDEDFRILCDDYTASAQAVEQCRLSDVKDKEFENEF